MSCATTFYPYYVEYPHVYVPYRNKASKTEKAHSKIMLIANNVTIHDLYLTNVDMYVYKNKFLLKTLQITISDTINFCITSSSMFLFSF